MGANKSRRACGPSFDRLAAALTRSLKIAPKRYRHGEPHSFATLN